MPLHCSFSNPLTHFITGNAAIESQAFCRVYRIGQGKEVEVVRITIEDSIDDRLETIQQSKSENIDRAMGPEVLSARDTVSNLLRICGMKEDENAEDGFTFLSDITGYSENGQPTQDGQSGENGEEDANGANDGNGEKDGN
jgi:hypothetical protein